MPATNAFNTRIPTPNIICDPALAQLSNLLWTRDTTTFQLPPLSSQFVFT